MFDKKLGFLLACSFTLTGCVDNGQGQYAIDPMRIPAVIAAPFVAAMAPPVVATPVYEPQPYDAEIVAIPESDIAVIGGDTYYWYVDPAGHRFRRFYAHGDHRDELFKRREMLHGEMARHGGHLPNREEIRAEQAHPMPSHPAPGKPAAKPAPKKCPPRGKC